MKIQFFSVILTLVFFSCKKNDNNNPINSIDPPNNPVQLKANVVSVSRVVLEWIDSSSNEDGFLIERKGSGTAYAMVGTTSSNINTFEDTGIQTDSTYTYRIYAYNLSGRSAQSTNDLTVMIPNMNLQGVTIGSQIWSAKNLDVTQYLNGDPIPQVSNPFEWETLTTGAWCWYDNDSLTYASTYGKLYNWYAVKDSRGLAPDGWHVPSESDWNNLVITIDPNADNSCPASCTQSILAGGELKEAGLSHWFNPNIGANNSTGFTALPGGGRDVDGSYFYLGNYGHWWSAGSYNESDAYVRILSYSGASIKKAVSYKKLGYSVRVVKN